MNPVAGRDAGPDYLQVLNERLRETFGVLDIVMTIGPGDAAAAAQDAAAAGCERIFVAGGDGTLNEALNGVAQVEGALERVTFGIIPVGTGNDFAGAIGIPPTVEEALATVAAGRKTRVDVGRLGDLHFVNVSAGGFIAEVSDAVDPQLKSIAGKLAYLIGGAQVLLDYEPVHAEIEFEGEHGTERRALEIQTFAVCNSRMIGGGRLIAPQAWVDDGWLDVCVIESMPTPEFIRLLTSVSKGEHIEDPRVSYFNARSVRFDFARSIKVNTDGEVLEATSCRYELLPRAAEFFIGETTMAVSGK